MTPDMQTRSAGAAAHARVPADAFWIPRLMHEAESPFAPPDDRLRDQLERSTQGWLALAAMASQPWALASAQWSILNLAFTHLGAMQAEWIDAWSRLLSVPGGDPGNAPAS
jgi:hypothetical protein